MASQWDYQLQCYRIKDGREVIAVVLIGEHTLDMEIRASKSRGDIGRIVVTTFSSAMDRCRPRNETWVRNDAGQWETVS